MIRWRLTFLALPYLLFVLEWLLLRRAMKRGWLRELIALTGFVAASKFIGFEVLGADAFNPELPRWLIFFWGWLESIVWIGLSLGVIAALIALLHHLVSPRGRAWAPTLGWTALALSAMLAFYGMYDGMRVASVVERELVLADLPREFDGYRIAHVSDLHCSPAARRDKIASIVERVNLSRPDLIAISGDFVDGLPAQRAADLEPIRNLRATDGVFGSMGNHEHYWNFWEWQALFEKWNVRMLRNTSVTIRRGPSALALGGVDDKTFGLPPKTVFDTAPADAFRVLIYHRPSNCDFFVRQLGVRLQLSGHTHGGVMPIIRRFVAAKNGGHDRGVYREGQLTLHVSPGTGQWAGFPLRMFDPPEITILVLRRGNHEAHYD